MKRILLTAGILLLLVFLLLHPQEGLAAARTGMTLWLNSLIPALLPFIILTGVLIHTGSIEKILLPFRPLFEFLLGVSVYGGYVFLLGMLCGYPMGAKLASDMYESHKISRREAEYLTTFCNNASPSFIITYLGQICLLNKVPASRLFLCLFLSDFICMMIFRLLIYRNHLPGSVPHTDRHDEKRDIFRSLIGQRSGCLYYERIRNYHPAWGIYSPVFHTCRLHQPVLAILSCIPVCSAGIHGNHYRTVSHR